MHVLRPIRGDDLPALQTLAAGIAGGMTSLPPDAALLSERLNHSLRSFDPSIRSAGAEYYLFVLEDARSGAVVGTSGIVARVGGYDPFYTYEVREEAVEHAPLGLRKRFDVLHLRRAHKGPSELCSLFLRPESRAGGLGRLLSLGRLLFIAAFTQRFAPSVIAELRGWQTADGRSPFWECVGRQFFDRDFQEADFLSGLGDKDFINDLMPRHPIYVPLLPPEVRAVIGEVHRDTLPARRLLEGEGFQFVREVDIFDAGPVLSAPTQSIRTVARARRRTAHRCETLPPQEPRALIANGRLDFRCVLNRAREEGNRVLLEAETLAVLGVGEGDPLWLCESETPRTV